MQKEIHFYEYTRVTDYTSWKATEEAINNNESHIETTQMGLLSADLIYRGYRIFIHEDPHTFYEIKLGCDNERTNREIRLSHNLFKMWRAGEFAKPVSGKDPWDTGNERVNGQNVQNVQDAKDIEPTTKPAPKRKGEVYYIVQTDRNGDVTIPYTAQSLMQAERLLESWAITQIVSTAHLAETLDEAYAMYLAAKDDPLAEPVSRCGSSVMIEWQEGGDDYDVSAKIIEMPYPPQII